MQPYEWTCHVCAATNAREVDECTSCGFPASAPSNAIFAAREARAQGKKLPVQDAKPSGFEALKKFLAPMPFVSQVVAVLAGLTALSGIILVRSNISFSELAFGLGMFFGGILVVGGLAEVHHKEEPKTGPSKRGEET